MSRKKTVDCVIPFFQKPGVPTLPMQKMAEAFEKLLAEFENLGSFFVNLPRPCNPPSQILMKLWEIIELVILSKMIPISTNLVLEVKSYGRPKIAIFVFTQM